MNVCHIYVTGTGNIYVNSTSFFTQLWTRIMLENLPKFKSLSLMALMLHEFRFYKHVVPLCGRYKIQQCEEVNFLV